MSRIRADYVFGNTTAALTTTGTTLSSPALARLPVVTAPDVAAITLHDETAGTYEIVHVTAHTAAATTATILRAQEGSAARAWVSGTRWAHGLTVGDVNAGAIPSTPTGGIAATTVQAALAELDTEKAGTGHTHTAASVSYAGSTNLAATDVEAALDELDAEKAAVAHLGVAGTGGLAYQTVAQSIAHSTDTAVSLDSELFDTGGYHDNVTNNSRLTVPTGKGGTYLITGGVRFATNGTGVRLIYLLKNGVTILGSASATPPSSYPATPTFSFVAPLVAGDYIQAMAYQDSGAALSTNVTLGSSIFLGISRIGD